MKTNNALKTIAQVIKGNQHKPVFAFRPNTLKQAAHFFLKSFRGSILYAVKTNPETHILTSLYDHGVSSFDVASLEEIMLLRGLLPEATLYFMHPVKSREAIYQAYHHYGVRHFSLDSYDELYKILHETSYAPDLCLHVRLSIPNTYAELTLAEKFGVSLQDAPALLREVSSHASQLGICFHTGSQCMHPDAYKIAIRMAGEVIIQAGVKVHFFNVGGGFPSVYPGMIPPDLQEYFDTIHEEFKKIHNCKSMHLLAEPGRALVAESTSLIVKVILRKGPMLYINDGTYGSLFDAGAPQFIFPVKLVQDRKASSSNLIPFSFYGPTCDSLDFMKGPFYLPGNIKEGDYIEIGQMGAYGRTMTTFFNGFKPAEEVFYVSDKPLMTMYQKRPVTYKKPENIAA